MLTAQYFEVIGMNASTEKGSTEALLSHFFAQDDLGQLTADAGALLDCPLLVIDDTFHVAAHFTPTGFSDLLFDNAIRTGEITYEAGAIISNSAALSAGQPDFVDLADSTHRRRFAPLVSAGVRLGYLICVDVDGRLQRVAEETFRTVERILAKQLFIEASRQDKPFETAEEILMHLLDGGFPAASYFKLQASSTYLADFHPTAFALIDLAAYHTLYLGKSQLKDELTYHFYASHPFIYKGDIFLFLHKGYERQTFETLAAEFHLKVVITEGVDDLYALPALYRTARESLDLITEDRFHSGSVFTVAELAMPLLLQTLGTHRDLTAPEVRALAACDREKGSQYCETLYWYLSCGRSLKGTCEALFTHRNTILYRIRRMQEDFGIPLETPAAHLSLLLSVSLVLFEAKGPDFFLRPAKEKSTDGAHAGPPF